MSGLGLSNAQAQIGAQAPISEAFLKRLTALNEELGGLMNRVSAMSDRLLGEQPKAPSELTGHSAPNYSGQCGEIDAAIVTASGWAENISRELRRLESL